MELIARLQANLRRVLRGKHEAIDLLLAAFSNGGNVLLTDVPGVGKTTLAKALAASIGGSFQRVQFTPDLLPADILGGAVYNPAEGRFDFRQGPVFANVLLADEINRASPRTQSSLLEAMAEGQVSIEGKSRALPSPFWVIATQNPVEHHGTYPLPEAQLDRFSVELALGYPPEDDEVGILTGLLAPPALAGLEQVGSIEQVTELVDRVSRLHIEPDLCRYVVRLVTATRSEPRLQLGASPRGGISLVRMAQGYAAVAGRDHVLADDIQAVAVSTLAHRVMLETKAKYSGVDKAQVIRELVANTPVPV